MLAAAAGLVIVGLAGCATPLPPVTAPAVQRPDGRERAEEDREKEPRPDNPGEALRFRLQSLMDENGYIPMDGLERAKAHVGEMRALMAAQPPGIAGITRTSWTWLGPGNIGGRTRALAIHPTSPSTIFAGTVGGGIWKTTNGGGTWAPVNDFMANLAVSTIVFKPGDPTTMYAGTGEGFFNADGIRGNGIFKSTDGGTTWTQLGSTSNSSFLFVNRLAFSADGSIVLAATRTGLYRTVDAGASWTLVFSIGGSEFTDVKFLPGSSTSAVASGYTAAAYYSFNVAGSGTWAPSSLALGGSFNRVELATSPSAPNNVYAVLDVGNGQLWKSTNGGANYAQVSTPAHLSGQGWYNNAVWVDPTNDNVLVVGGLDLHRSINGGATFTRISTWFDAPRSAHADHHAIVADPQYDGVANRRVYFANDGGVYKADNVLTVTTGVGGGFTSLLNNFGATQFYGAAGNPSTGRVTGGTQDNGTLLFTTAGGTQGWTAPFGGDGGFSAYDPTDANYFYGEYVGLQIHRNSTGGASGSQYIYGASNSGGCKAAPYVITDVCSGQALFISPFILDPNDANTLLAGGLSLWRTNDVKAPLTTTTGPQWTAIKPPITGNFVYAIAVAPGNSNVIYVGHGNGDVYRTTNGTAAAPAWTKVDGATMPNIAVRRIAVDPLNLNNVYVAFGSFGTSNLWRSTDGGATWNLSVGSGATGLPGVPIRGIAVHPVTSGWVYVGTEVGVFASADGGATWSVPNDGPANVSVDEVFFMGTRLVAATHGRGIFSTPTNVFATDMALGSPANGTVAKPFSVSGWALNRGAASGTGVDAIHVWAAPAAGGGPIFLGAAGYGDGRPDVAAIYGPQFTNSGFSLSAGASLAPGNYIVTAYAHNAITGAFDATRSANITIAAPVSNGFLFIDTPTPSSTLTSAFEVGGWALDAGAPTGTGVDWVQFYVFPDDGAAPGVFMGTGSYGGSRPDVAAIFGSRFTNVGFHFTITGLGPGNFLLGAFAHSTVTGGFTLVKTLHFTVNANALMSIDIPSAEATITAPAFAVSGWAIDRGNPSATDTGVDAIHVYAYRNPGSGEPAIFLGLADTGIARGDLGGIYGPRYTNCGYTLTVNAAAAGLTPGVYNIVVFAHSTATSSFNNLAIVRVTIQ